MGVVVITAVVVGFALGWLYRSRLTARRVRDVGGVPAPIADRDDADVHLVAHDSVRSTSSMRARMPSDPAIVTRLARGSIPPPSRSVVGELVIPERPVHVARETSSSVSQSTPATRSSKSSPGSA